MYNHAKSGKLRFDAVVIGSGMGGGTAAYRLAKSGLKTLLLERGDFVDPKGERPAQPGIFIEEIHAPADGEMSYVGGQAKFYGASMYRLRESDFRAVSHEAGVSPAWPLSYGDLEPYYCEAEELYRVHGEVGDDPTEPPHSLPYPFPSLPHDGSVAKLFGALRAAGSRVSSIPKALDYSKQGSCVLCGTCDAHFCTRDAKVDPEIACIRPALATGLLTLLTRADCIKVLTDASGTRVEGVLVRHSDEVMEVSAPIVVLSGGILNTPLLLWRSRTDAHPEGLGNAAGALGRYLSGQSSTPVFPVVGRLDFARDHVKTFSLNEFYDQGPDWPYPMGTIQVCGLLPFWKSSTLPIRPLAFALGKVSLMCFCVTEALPDRETGYTFGGDGVVDKRLPIWNAGSLSKLRSAAIEAFRKAGYVSFAPRATPHVKSEVGTARCGDDPVTSVTDPDCQVHGVQGLFVADASVLATAGAVNTALTIAAMALRAADKAVRNH